MTDSLRVVPTTDEVRTGILEIDGIALALADVLSDTYCLMCKTHGYHWNVEGPLFYSVHKVTEEQYENMFEAADVLAERIRALGHLAPMKLASAMEMSVIDDPIETPSAGAMVEDLSADHERVAHRMRALIGLAEKQRDEVTADLAIERSAFHEKAAWMLRAIAAQ